MAKNIDTFLDKANKKLENERKQRMKENGLNELLVLEQGENKIEIKRVEPEEVKTQYGVRQTFVVRKGKDIYNLMVSEKSPLYREFIKLMMQVKDEFIPVVIIRTGNGVQTRYSIKQ